MKSDAELLSDYVTGEGETAFAELVQRHGAMVYRVCLRITNDVHKAEDASQGTFIVLARKANTLQKRGQLSSWLHGVARRVALEAVRTRRTQTQREAAAMVEKPISDDNLLDVAVKAEALSCLDSVLASLPKTLREAVVLRYLEGASQKEAAEIVGCPQGTLAWRASKGLDMLRHKLARQGVALSALALMGIFEHEVAAAAPMAVLSQIPVMASSLSLNGSMANKAYWLAQCAMKTMLMQKVMMIAGAVFIMTSLGFGALQAVAYLHKTEEATITPDAPYRKKLPGYVYPCESYLARLESEKSIKPGEYLTPIFPSPHHRTEFVHLPDNTEIRSVAAGEVMYAGFLRGQPGQGTSICTIVIIEHELDDAFADFTKFCSIYVYLGNTGTGLVLRSQVKKGQRIGMSAKQDLLTQKDRGTYLCFSMHKGPYYQVPPSLRKRYIRNAPRLLREKLVLMKQRTDELDAEVITERSFSFRQVGGTEAIITHKRTGQTVSVKLLEKRYSGLPSIMGWCYPQKEDMSQDEWLLPSSWIGKYQ